MPSWDAIFNSVQTVNAIEGQKRQSQRKRLCAELCLPAACCISCMIINNSTTAGFSDGYYSLLSPMVSAGHASDIIMKYAQAGR